MPRALISWRPVSLGTLACFLFVCAINLLILRTCSPSEDGGGTRAALVDRLPPVRSDGEGLEDGVLKAVQDILTEASASKDLRKRVVAALARRVQKQRAGDRAAAAPARAAAESGEADDAEEPDPTQLFSQQTCYLGADESELCEYHNALCFDGEGPVVVVAKPVRQPPRVLDYTHNCLDNRFYEPTALPWSNCHWGFAVQRPYKQEDVSGMPNSDYSLPLALRRWGPQNRGEAMIFREISAEEVYGKGEDALYAAEEEEEGEGKGGAADVRRDDGEEGEGKGGAADVRRDDGEEDGQERRTDPSLRRRRSRNLGDAQSARGSKMPGPHLRPDALLAAVDGAAPFPHPDVPAVSLRASYRVGNRTIDWLDGALWLSAFQGQWDRNPFHFLAKTAMLWDAQRNNATGGFGGHAGDGWLHWQSEEDIAVANAVRPLPESPHGTPETRSRARWVQGSSWGPLPPMDVLLFSGPGAVTLGSQDRLQPWFRGVLELATQSRTRAFFGDLTSRYSDERLLCARRGTVLGTKYRVFSGPGDGTVFRNAAYKAAGVEAVLPPGEDPESSPLRGSLGSYPRFPPRRITVLDRQSAAGRGVTNLHTLLTLVQGTGLDVRVVEDMSALSFSDQVQLMASTGILIAPHGAALTNLVFLPAHAVVIELFPYGLKKTTYRTLAGLASVQYYPVYSDARVPPTSTEGVAGILYSRYYWANCVAVNISAYDGIAEHACNQAGKLHNVIVPLDLFSHTLRHAVDSIGAFSLLNKEWAALAKQQGVQPPSYEEWTARRPQELIDAQGDPRNAEG